MKFKKLATLFLSVMMLATLFVGISVEAAANIAPNSDFSAVNADGLPTDWEVRPAKADWRQPTETLGGDKISVVQVSDSAIQGTTALQFESPQGGKSFSVALGKEHRDMFIPGTTYKVSLMYKWIGGGGGANLIFDYSDSETLIDWTIVDEETPYHVSAVWIQKSYSNGKWIKAEATMTIPEDRKCAWISLETNASFSGTLQITDVVISGLRQPITEKNPTELIANGDFASGTTGWTLSGASAVTESDNTYISVPTANASATTSFTVGTEKVYALSVNVKSSVESAAKIWISNTNNVTNLDTGDFFFNRWVNYGYTFASTGGEWKTIQFNVFPSDYVSEVTVSLQCAAEDATLAFDNLSVKPTKELLGNGDFESVQMTARLSADGVSGTTGMPGWSLPSTKISYSTQNAHEGTSAKLTYAGGAPFLGQSVRIEAGKTYKLTGMVNTTTNVYMPGFYGILSNSLTGLTYKDPATNKAIAAQSELAAQFLAPTNINGWYAFENYITIPTTYTPNATIGAVDWPTEEMGLNFRFRQNNSEGNFYMLDNVSLTEVKEGAEFYTALGEKLESVPKGESVNAYYNYFSKSIDSEDVTMIVALYEMIEDVPCLVKYTTAKGSASSQKPGVIRGAIDVPNDTEAEYMISAFCLDSMLTLHAMAGKTTLR